MSIQTFGLIKQFQRFIDVAFRYGILNRFIKVAFRIVQHRFAFLRRDWRWRSDRRGGIAYRYRPGTGRAEQRPDQYAGATVGFHLQFHHAVSGMASKLDREYPG